MLQQVQVKDGLAIGIVIVLWIACINFTISAGFSRIERAIKATKTCPSCVKAIEAKTGTELGRE